MDIVTAAMDRIASQIGGLIKKVRTANQACQRSRKRVSESTGEVVILPGRNPFVDDPRPVRTPAAAGPNQIGQGNLPPGWAEGKG